MDQFSIKCINFYQKDKIFIITIQNKNKDYTIKFYDPSSVPMFFECNCPSNQFHHYSFTSEGKKCKHMIFLEKDIMNIKNDSLPDYKDMYDRLQIAYKLSDVCI